MNGQTAIMTEGFWVKLLATFFYVGHLPKAPGTWASSITAVILYFVWPSGWYFQFLIIVAVYFAGVWLGTKAEPYFGHDGRPIVIDEVAGQMTALFMARRMIVPFVLAVILFRVFDIIKPPPARLWESHRGGRGVMNDDIAAGVYAAVTMQFLLALLNRWGVPHI